MASYVDIILREEVLWDSFLQWISGHHLPESESCQLKLQCSRSEFALCFLNYLRDQTSRILSNGSKRTLKTCLTSAEKNTPPVEVVNDISKNATTAGAKIPRKSICSPDKSVCDSTSDERSPSHVKYKVVNGHRNSREGAVCVNSSSFDSSIVSYSHHFHPRKSSPKQVQHYESSPHRDHKAHHDSSTEKSHNRSPREPWNCKNTQNATLWDYVSKDNNLGARRKNGSENGGKEERNQDKKCGAKVNTRQKRQRRINPTRVIRNVEGGESEGMSTSQMERQPFGLPQEVPPPAAAFSFGAKETSVSNSSSFAEERALMREERMKMQSSDHDQVTSSPPKTSYILRNQNTEPVLSLVTHKKELDLLAAIFTILINKNLIPNILSEMCFLCNLLTVESNESSLMEKSSDEAEAKTLEYFSSVHNCAYFAVEVLSKLRTLLQLLDRNTQRMLSENARLARFSPSLVAHLTNKDRVPRKSIVFPQNSSATSSSLTSFQTDVDNSKNFPNDRSFRLFCRQRDEFCEALRTWESGRSMPGWSFSVVIGPRIRSILTPANSTPEPTNFVHLARFFRAQLLANCGNSSLTGMEESSNSGEVVPIALRDADPSKLQRLQRRLIWPSRSRGGCCPVPSFPGAQEFFRDFIVYGASHMFNEHLKDGLVSDILNLNDSQFTASELEDQDKVDDDTRSEYIKCVLNMQLLAKFLGFLVFLPYQCENRLPDNIMLAYCALRNKVMPVMDLIGLLWTAKQQRHLSITIPWMVVFLSMIDRVTSGIDYYKEKFFPLLIAVYRDIDAGKEPTPMSHAMFLVKLCLGWLFEQPNFPQEAVFRDKALPVEIGNANGADGGVISSKLKGPDDLDLIDEFVVNIICPFLSELRMMMSDSSSGRSGSGANIVRHITPVSTSDKLIAVSSSRLLELKLEECFFSNQPASVRRTVDFVSERIASTCVRHICNQLLPKAMKRGLVQIHNSVLSKVKENSSANSAEEGQTTEKFELAMAREIQHVSSEEWLTLKKECLEYSDCECERRAWDAIPPLLPQSVDEAVSLGVCQMCVQVTIRTAKQKVRRWIMSHTSAALFAKEYEAEVGKLVASLQKPSEIKMMPVEESDEISTANVAAAQEEDACCKPASEIISQLREMILEIMKSERDTKVEMKVVQELLEDVSVSIANESNYTPPSLKTIFSLTVDLAIFLVAHGVKTVGKATSSPWNWDMFIPLWTRLASSSSSNDAFSRILSPRNLYMLSLMEDGGHSAGGKSTWATRLSSLLSALLSSKLLNPKQLEEQSLVVLHTAWPQEFLARYSECIKGVLDHPEVKHCSDDDNDDANTSALLMEWLAESCATMEILE